jgi:hypothetical protein
MRTLLARRLLIAAGALDQGLSLRVVDYHPVGPLLRLTFGNRAKSFRYFIQIAFILAEDVIFPHHPSVVVFKNLMTKECS